MHEYLVFSLQNEHGEMAAIVVIPASESNKFPPIHEPIKIDVYDIRFVVSATYKTETNRRRVARLAWTNNSSKTDLSKVRFRRRANVDGLNSTQLNASTVRRLKRGLHAVLFPRIISY